MSILSDLEGLTGFSTLTDHQGVITELFSELTSVDSTGFSEWGSNQTDYSSVTWEDYQDFNSLKPHFVKAVKLYLSRSLRFRLIPPMYQYEQNSEEEAIRQLKDLVCVFSEQGVLP